MRNIAWWVACGLFTTSLHSLALAAPITLNGAGATFPYPLYSKWFTEFHRSDSRAQINYQSIGSGGGIRQFQEQTVDFGASDAPMTDSQMQKAARPVVHFPTTLGAVAITYHLPGLTSVDGSDLKLHLDGETLSEIYLGKIKKWNDPKLLALNPSLSLPARPIFVSYRADGSGTTYVFADYLAKISPDWKKRVGVGTALRWPIGLGGKGNEGVTGLVKQTPYSIGYVELIYAQQNRLPVAGIKNASGHSVSPTLEGLTEAAASFSKLIPEDYRVSITNPPGKKAYPIAAFTYLLLPRPLPPGEKGVLLHRFLEWSLGQGQILAAQMGYAPLPKALVARLKKTAQSLNPKSLNPK